MKQETIDKLINLGVGLGVVFGVYKFAPASMSWLKAAALGAGGVMVAKQLPFTKSAL